ncbi:MAG: hypothetical protein Alpg2KO_17580 [Alphaproteobacteria bacterium]
MVDQTCASELLDSADGQWGKGDSAILKAPVAAGGHGVSVEIRYRVSGELDIQYIAVGWKLPGKFVHCKHKHVPVEGEYAIQLRPDDLAIKLSMGWAEEDVAGAGIELWCKFNGTSKGKIELVSVTPVDDARAVISAPGEELQKFCHDMLVLGGLSKYEGAVDLARDMVDTPVLYLAPHESVPLDEHGFLQGGYQGLSNTQRYMYHALGHARILLIAYGRTGRDEFLTLARQHASHWITQYYDAEPDDLKYAYYDHGTAERLAVMCGLWSVLKSRKASVTEVTRLEACMIAHVRLLANWSFVARNQRVFIHNHAVFQAVFCIAAGVVLENHPESENWIAHGADVLGLQVDGLVSADGVSIENSTGYHMGLHRMMDNSVGLLLSLDYPMPEAVRQVRSKIKLMKAFTERVKFSGKLMPAVGDTKYSMNRLLGKIPPARRGQLHHDDMLTLFEHAGYASLKDSVEGVGEVSVLLVASGLARNHKHMDDLSFTLACARGIQWIADPGYHKYDESEPSLYARRPDAHNAPWLPELEYAHALGQTGLSGGMSPDRTHWHVSASHGHYKGITVERRLDWSSETAVLVVSDHIAGADLQARVELSLTLGDGVTATRNDNGNWQLTYTSQDGEVERGPVIAFEGHNASYLRDARLFPVSGIIEAGRLKLDVAPSEGAAQIRTVIAWDEASLTAATSP